MRSRVFHPPAPSGGAAGLAGWVGSAARGGAAGRGGSGGGIACRVGVASIGEAARRGAWDSDPPAAAVAVSDAPGPAPDAGGAAGSFQAVAAWNGCLDLSFFETIVRALGWPATARSIESFVAW